MGERVMRGSSCHAKRGLVDEEHDSGVGDDAHEVCAQSTV